MKKLTKKVVVGLADNLGEFELTRPALNGVS
jgi:hypothetical protein